MERCFEIVSYVLNLKKYMYDKLKDTEACIRLKLTKLHPMQIKKKINSVIKLNLNKKIRYRKILETRFKMLG